MLKIDEILEDSSRDVDTAHNLRQVIVRVKLLAKRYQRWRKSLTAESAQGVKDVGKDLLTEARVMYRLAAELDDLNGKEAEKKEK